MRVARQAMVLAAACLGLAALPAMAPAQGNPFADLIAKGKNSLDNLDYAAADAVWHQLLALPISRQRRIDVLQLLAATTYPNDTSHQNKDSAAAIVKQVVSMGARRMYVKDVSWSGLDSLFNAIVAATPASEQPYDSPPDVIALIADGYQPGEIADRVSIDCYTFAFDELDAAVRRMRSQTGLGDALKHKCSQLLVESDPANANLTVATRDFGVVPDGGLLRWVQPAASTEVSVTKGQTKLSKVVDLPIGKLLQAKFYLPKDTLPLPAIRTAEQIATDLGLFAQFRPSTPRPPEPERPHGMSAFATGLIWGILGGAAGYAVGQFVPSVGCNSPYTVPQGDRWRVRGQVYTGGQSVNLGSGSGCTMTIAGGTGLGMFLLSSVIKSSSNRSADARYEESSRAYPGIVKSWESTERRSFADKNPEVRDTLATEQARRAQTQSDNAAIRARNASLPEPEITVRDLMPDVKRAGEAKKP